MTQGLTTAVSERFELSGFTPARDSTPVADQSAPPTLEPYMPRDRHHADVGYFMPAIVLVTPSRPRASRMYNHTSFSFDSCAEDGGPDPQAR